MPPPSPVEMTRILLENIRHSRKKNYHNSKTDFSRIHASGVSKILLKGESYSCNTNIKRVMLEEIWGFPNNTIFLDASCLVFLFDSANTSPEHIDFSNTFGCKQSIKHSGDVVDADTHTGKHVINVDLVKLPKNVQTLYFTISAWTTRLSDILHPNILFVDPDTDQQLCSYQFGDNKNTGENTAVIMAKLTRLTPTSNWQVVAIGHIGRGTASNYEPMIKDIKGKNL